ncbi:MAG TPA: hypothetical protein VL326_16745 [Kofleriaceae bacterium]|jgi:hypothetical protein|nr:hypothetical protein [Kofleriaceae bacterium]
MRALVLAVLLIPSATACRRSAIAQTTRDPYGPVRCFEIADAKQLSGQSAIQLCAGALSDAPGQCFATGIDNEHELSSQKLLTLCTGATSLEPLACYKRLHDTGKLTEDQVIQYCAPFCPLGPAPPQSSNPDCLAEAMDRTTLALQTAGELCAAASSAGPVYCFLAGLDEHKLSESDLVTLCRERVQCQYVNPPEGY